MSRARLVLWISLLTSMFVGVTAIQAQTLKNGGIHINGGTENYKEIQNYSGSKAGTIKNYGTINITVSGGSGSLLNDGGTPKGTVLNYVGGSGTGTIICGATTGDYQNGGGVTRNDSLNNYVGIIKIKGALTNSGTFDSDTGTVEYNSTAAQTVASAAYNNTYGNLTITGASTKSLDGNITVRSGLTINTGATLSASASNYIISMNGNWVNNGGTFAPNSGIVNFNGTSSQTIGGTASSTFSTLKVNNTAGVTLGVATTATSITIGDVTSNSIFNDGGYQLTSTGTLAITSGTFNLGNGATATNYPGFTAITGPGTFNYASTSSQTIAAVNYGNLTNSGNGNRTLASSGTIGIAGTFTPGSGTYTVTGSTVNFNGTSTQTVNGSGSFTFNTLKINNTAGVTLGVATSVSTLTIGDVTSSSIFSDGGYQLISTGTLNLTSGTFNLGNGATATSYPGFTTNNIGAGTTVNYASTSAQTIGAADYGNLTNSGNGNRTLASSGTIGIAGIFTKGSGTYTVTGSTVNYSGGAQAIANIDYNNLTLTNTGTKTFAAGTTNITGNFTLAGGATGDATTNSTTINYNGSGTQDIANISYYNLTLSTSGTKRFAAGTTNIAGNFTISGTATADAATNNSTINYNGGAQAVAAMTYTNLNLTSSGTKTLIGDVAVNGSVTLGSGVTLSTSASNYNISLTGDWTNNGGTFTANTGTVTLNGTGVQAIGGSSATTFYNLTLSNSGTKTINDAISGTDVTVTTLSTSSDCGQVINNGDIVVGTGGITINGSSTQFQNNKTITINNGDLNNAGIFTNDGTVTVN